MGPRTTFVLGRLGGRVPFFWSLGLFWFGWGAGSVALVLRFGWFGWGFGFGSFGPWACFGSVGGRVRFFWSLGLFWFDCWANRVLRNLVSKLSF